MCPALFTNRKNLVVHMADAHEVHILADAAFVCSIAECGRRFVKRSTLHRHMQVRKLLFALCFLILGKLCLPSLKNN